mmetsp:Transcript_5389/g.19104  ORF Transcript_5389/g.19104 Transcript_5389/m.19104 type:complete len:274 (+) Transcript_5389:727-1548(+)
MAYAAKAASKSPRAKATLPRSRADGGGASRAARALAGAGRSGAAGAAAAGERSKAPASSDSPTFAASPTLKRRPPTSPSTPSWASFREKSSKSREASCASSASPRWDARPAQSDSASTRRRPKETRLCSECSCRAQPSQKPTSLRHWASPPGYESLRLAARPRKKAEAGTSLAASASAAESLSMSSCALAASQSGDSGEAYQRSSSCVTLPKTSTACARTCRSASVKRRARPSRPPARTMRRFRPTRPPCSAYMSASAGLDAARSDSSRKMRA